MFNSHCQVNFYFQPSLCQFSRVFPKAVVQRCGLEWVWSYGGELMRLMNQALIIFSVVIYRVSCKKVYPTLKVNIQYFLSTKSSNIYKHNTLRIHWGLSTILKTSKQSTWTNFFDIEKVYIYIYSESLFNILYIEVKYKCLKSFLRTK